MRGRGQATPAECDRSATGGLVMARHETLRHCTWKGARLAAGVLAAAALTLLAMTGAPAGALGLGPAPDLSAGARALGVDVDVLDAPAASLAATRGARASALARAEAQFRKARAAQRAHLFTQATELYGNARLLYVEAGSTVGARACRTAINDIFLVAAEYPATRAEMLDALADDVPGGAGGAARRLARPAEHRTSALQR